MTALQFLGNFTRILFALIVAFVGLPSAMVSAELHTVSAVGEYTMSDYEEPQIAELRALDYAKRSAVEKAGVYVKAYTKTKQMQISEDEVNAIASSKINISNQKVSRQLDTAGNIRIRMEITATVDTADVDDVLAEEAQKRRDGIKRYNEIKALNEEQDRQIAELRGKIATIPNGATAMEANAREQQERLNREFMSNQKIEEASKVKVAEGEVFLREAIRHNPKNALAYYKFGKNCERQIAGVNKKTENERIKIYKTAIKYYNMSLLLNPNFSDAYIDKASAYSSSLTRYVKNPVLEEKYKQLAIRNLKKAISVDPSNPRAYEDLGELNSDSNENYAIACYEKAFELRAKKIEKNPQDASEYEDRAFSYGLLRLVFFSDVRLSNYSDDDFIDDVCRAVRLDPRCYYELSPIDGVIRALEETGTIDTVTAAEYRARIADAMKH